jgi:hypothetical protein
MALPAAAPAALLAIEPLFLISTPHYFDPFCKSEEIDISSLKHEYSQLACQPDSALKRHNTQTENSDMIKTDAKTKTTGLLILTALLTVLITGCSKEEAITAPPAAEPIDLAQVPDLFEQPLQPNPLALTAEDVIITVNGEEITHGKIMQATQQQMMMLSQQQRVPPQQLGQLYPQVYKEMTDTLVANILLTQAAEKSSLVISDEAVAEEVAKIEANAPEGKNLRDLLAENKMDFDEWKTDLRKQMLVGKLV